MKAQPSSSKQCHHGSMGGSRGPGQRKQAAVLVDQRQEALQQRQLQELMRAGPRIQRKLTIGAVDDPLEREADRVADQVMRMSEPSPTLMKTHSSNQPPMQLLPLKAETTLQRQSPEQGGEEEEEQLLQPRKQSGQVPEVSSNFEAQIQSIRGAGQPLSPSTRAFFEPRFGTDFSGVRLHTGSTADQLNSSLKARAFTTGQDVFFRQGEYDAGSARGKELLAHELTHVVQQTGALKCKLPLGQSRDVYEQEAGIVISGVLRKQVNFHKPQAATQDQIVQREEMPETAIPGAGKTEKKPARKNLNERTIQVITAIAIAESEATHSAGQEVSNAEFYYKKWLDCDEAGFRYSSAYRPGSTEYKQKGIFRIYMVALGDDTYANETPEKSEYINKEINIGVYVQNNSWIAALATYTYLRVKPHLEELHKLELNEVKKRIPWTDQGSFDDMNREDNAKYRQYFLLQNKDDTLVKHVKVLPAADFRLVTFHFDRPSIDKYFNKSPITDKVPKLTKEDVQAFVITGSKATSSAQEKQSTIKKKAISVVGHQPDVYEPEADRAGETGKADDVFLTAAALKVATRENQVQRQNEPHNTQPTSSTTTASTTGARQAQPDSRATDTGSVTLQWPVDKDGSRVTQCFKPTNLGIDISQEKNKPVYAAASGTVIKAGPVSGYGSNYVNIRHNNMLITGYGHMESKQVKESDSVAQGQQIGTVGNQGTTIGPSGSHLHFNVISGANPRDLYNSNVDPLKKGLSIPEGVPKPGQCA